VGQCRVMWRYVWRPGPAAKTDRCAGARKQLARVTARARSSLAVALRRQSEGTKKPKRTASPSPCFTSRPVCPRAAGTPIPQKSNPNPAFCMRCKPPCRLAPQAIACLVGAPSRPSPAGARRATWTEPAPARRGQVRPYSKNGLPARVRAGRMRL
jgi:hypothetical protein